MSNIKLKANGIYLPKRNIKNKELEERLNLEDGYIKKRTGIEERYYVENEKIEEMALNAVKNIFNNNDITKDDIGLIITATTSTNIIMPGISNYIQKELGMKPCICLDILAGCSGYINAFDIARLYIDNKIVKKAIVIGVDILSKCLDDKDIGTTIVLSDGAGATLLEYTERETKYYANIKADGEKNEILTYNYGEKISMNGREIYKYAVTKTVENINEILRKANLEISDIKYIIPHQSNIRILKSIASRLNIDMEKLYVNIQKNGNTFCASIPIALKEMEKYGEIQEGDKIILLGYGGGLNTGSILFEY